MLDPDHKIPDINRADNSLDVKAENAATQDDGKNAVSVLAESSH